MAAVKGSKQEKMVVVPYRPWQAFLYRTSLVLCLLIVGFGAYYFGFSKGVYQNGDARAERDQLLIDREIYTGQINALRQELVNAEQANEVDRRALDDVQTSILGLREQIAQLEEDVLFYKQIMSPGNDETGLVIGQLDIFSLDQRNRFGYRLELKQMGSNDGLINGYSNVNILGTEGRQERSIPLRSLSADEDELDIRLQFRYFQNIEGELEIPEGFVPEKVQILAVAEGPNAKTVQKSFGWLVQDN